MITFILVWFFIIPGVIYSIWRHTNRYPACPQCGAPRSMIPSDTQIGQQHLRSPAQAPGLAAPQAAGSIREERPCPWCAEPILVQARVCKHCGRNVAVAVAGAGKLTD